MPAIDDPRPLALLVNPVAGRGRALRAAAEVAELWQVQGIEVRTLTGRDAAESAELAQRAVDEGCRALVACGGDGIVHHALQAVAGTSVPLGIIPAGSGNDHARMLGIPVGDPPSAAAIVAAGHQMPVDLGRLGERWFGTVLASGFDSRVVERMNRTSWPRGRLRYHRSLLAELAAFRPIPFELEIDGKPLATEAMLIAVGNGSCYGGGMRICPDADVSDGLFDVTVVSRISRLKLVRLFPKVYSGRHVRRPEVVTMRAREVRISAPAVTAFADGEPVGALPLTCTVVAAAVRIIVPEPGPKRDV